MNIKNTLKKTAGIAALVGIMGMYGCQSVPPAEEKVPNDSPSKPYTLVNLQDVKRQEEGTRVIVKGYIKNVEDQRIILESGAYFASVLRNNYSTTNEITESSYGTTCDEVKWESLEGKLKWAIPDPLDTANIYNNTVTIYGVVNKNGLLEMRFVTIDDKMYDAFK